MDGKLTLAAADAFRRLAESAPGADQRERWYALADRARRAYEAVQGHDGAVLAPVCDSGRVIGQHHHRAKLSDADVDLIHELRDAGRSLAQIAEKIDAPRSTVADIVAGRTRSHTVMGHRFVAAQTAVFWPASVDEFEMCG